MVGVSALHLPGRGAEKRADVATRLAVGRSGPMRINLQSARALIRAGGGAVIGRLSGGWTTGAGDHVLISVGGVGANVVLLSGPGAGEPAGPGGGGEALDGPAGARGTCCSLSGHHAAEKEMANRLLMSVQGIGAKALAGILGALGAGGDSRAIATADAVTNRRAEGRGPEGTAAAGGA